MKILLVFLFLFSFSTEVFLQVNKSSWEEIVPLHSTKQDVEQEFGNPINTGLSLYEKNNERILVEYAKETCIEHGWNILPNTVLSFSVYPKSTLKLDDFKVDRTNLPFATDDASNRFYTDVYKGIQYVVDSNDIVKTINYIPKIQDNKLRCKGFPKYDPFQKAYRPTVEFGIRNIKKDLVYFEGFINDIKHSTDLISYIFIYLKKGSPISQSKLYLRKVNDFFYKKNKFTEKQIQIEFGGYRDYSEIEVFHLPRNSPVPVATPKYPIR